MHRGSVLLYTVGVPSVAPQTLICPPPDRLFHNFRASQSGDCLSSFSSKMSCYGFWSSKVGKVSVGCSYHNDTRYVRYLRSFSSQTSLWSPLMYFLLSSGFFKVVRAKAASPTWAKNPSFPWQQQHPASSLAISKKIRGKEEKENRDGKSIQLGLKIKREEENEARKIWFEHTWLKGREWGGCILLFFIPDSSKSHFRHNSRRLQK